MVLNASADDQQGGTVATTLTLVPVNPAPVAINPLPDYQVAEDESFNLDVNTLFADGGNDADALTIAVTGLPDGLAYDALTGVISGNFATGTGSIAPYTVLLTVDDGQGGVLLESFDIRVTNDTFLETDADEGENDVSGGVRFDQLVDFGSDAPPLADLTVGNAISDVASLQSISSAGVRGDLTVQNATESVSKPSMSSQIAERDEPAGSLSAGIAPQGVPVSDDPRLERVGVNVVYRGDAVFIAIKPAFDEALDGRIESISARPAGDAEWPVWLKQVRADFLLARPPQGETSIDLDVRGVMASGEFLVKTVNVKLSDGVATPIDDAVLRLSSLGS